METVNSRLIDVLIVDDERMILGVAREIISEFGHRVQVAETGTAALAMLGEKPVDLLITDVMMPQMNGIELSREVRQQYPGVCVALMTGYSSLSLMKEAEGLGITDCLKKPFKTWELMGIVNRVAAATKTD
jgi:YesN/AraC family two-component response regulator